MKFKRKKYQEYWINWLDIFPWILKWKNWYLSKRKTKIFFQTRFKEIKNWKPNKFLHLN